MRKQKIVICDDEYMIQDKLFELLERLLQERGLEGEIEVYSNGEEFCREYRKGMFDLIFLDIELKNMNGVQVGRFIREECEDEEIQIAYISGKTKYALELFESRPINFVVKPITKDNIGAVLDKYLRITKQEVESFQYQKKREFVRISLSEIKYFTSDKRKVVMYCMNQTDTFYGNLNEVYEKVKGKHFLFVHKSFIINSHYVKRMEYEQVILLDNTTIPISQSRRAAIRKQFMQLKKEEQGWT